MNNPAFSPKKSLQAWKVVFFALLTSIALFLGVVLTMVKEPSFTADLTNPLFLALAVVTLTAIPAGIFISGKFNGRALEERIAEEKFRLYQTGLMIRFSTCESGALFSIVCFLLTDNLLPLVFLGISLFAFILSYPSRVKVAQSVNLAVSEFDLG